jgi:hypothetical protein
MFDRTDSKLTRHLQVGLKNMETTCKTHNTATAHKTQTTNDSHSYSQISRQAYLFIYDAPHIPEKGYGP